MTYTPQPLVWDDNVIRFRANAIVEFLLNAGPFDMNQLAIMPFSLEDREQFAQLIGYSVSDFGELCYVSPQARRDADEQASQMMVQKQPQEERR